MSIPQPDDNSERQYDEIISLIVDYVYDYEVVSKPALARAKLALIDSLGVAIESLARSKECTALVKPILAGATVVPGGFRLPGTNYSLDLLQGAFNMGAMIRYLDHNDAFAGAEWGHPSGKSLSATSSMSKHPWLTRTHRQLRGYLGDSGCVD